MKFFYQNLENKFNITYPSNKNATYSSKMNYSDNLEKPRQRWYRYKEGFSIDLVKSLINNYNKNENAIILDPFLGSGTTILAANELGFCGIGFETNPFSYFLSKCKLYNYQKEIILEFIQKYPEIINEAKNKPQQYSLPNLSIAKNVFEQEIEEYLMSVKTIINAKNYTHEKTKELLLLGWLSCIEILSNYRKAGNGLKKRKYSKPQILNKNDASEYLQNIYGTILFDIKNNNIKYHATIYNETSLSMDKYIPPESISGIVFSPPYANCFDYTEIYKLELWFGDFVQDYSDLKILRNKSLKSHLNGYTPSLEKNISTTSINYLISELKNKKLWNKKIPDMLKSYFNEMFKIIDNCYNILEKEGFCCIVVGNSAYGGVVFPTDLLLAEYAKQIGFEVDKIEIDRLIITSSQQYKITQESKDMLRESVICLVKH